MPGPRGRFSVRVSHVVRGYTTVTVAGRRIPVYGLPPGSLRPLAPARDDRRLDRDLGSLAARTTPAVAAYVHRTSGHAGAWNAGAEFEGASTLKLPIMVAALERIGGEPRATPYWAPFVAITRYWSNEAADEALELLGGSEVGGATDMVAAMRGLGLLHTYMYGGYLTDPDAGGGPPPAHIESSPPPSFKYTTAADMARLGAWLADAAAGSGAARPSRGDPARGARAALPDAARGRPGPRLARCGRTARRPQDRLARDLARRRGGRLHAARPGGRGRLRAGLDRRDRLRVRARGRARGAPLAAISGRVLARA